MIQTEAQILVCQVGRPCAHESEVMGLADLEACLSTILVWGLRNAELDIFVL